MAVPGFDDEQCDGVEDASGLTGERQMTDVDRVERAAQEHEPAHASPRCASHLGNNSVCTMRSTAGAFSRNSAAIGSLHVMCP